MNSTHKIILGLAMLTVAMGILAASFGWENATLKIHVKFAADQTQIFEEMRQRALSGDSASNAVECMNYIINYYPSGSKQVTGSPLDLIVERQRTNVINEIIEFLKAKTSHDLGNNPGPWIKKYSDRK